MHASHVKYFAYRDFPINCVETKNAALHGSPSWIPPLFRLKNGPGGFFLFNFIGMLRENLTK